MIETGTVGWDGEDLHYEKGTADNDGYTLLRVQVHRGRDYTKSLTPGVAQGHKILCHIPGGMFRIPPKGARVYIAYPTGAEGMSGAGIVMSVIEKTSPVVQHDDDRVVLDFGADTHVVIRGKSVSISDSANRFISVGTPRSGGDAHIVFQAADGTGGMIKEGEVNWFAAHGGTGTSLIQLTDGQVVVCAKGAASSMIKLDQNFTTICQSGFITASNLVLGGGPGTYLPALAGASGPAGLPSINVLIKTA